MTLPSVTRDELLYDEDTLNDVRYALSDGDTEPSAINIKDAVDANVMTYEILTAIRYWDGDGRNHRTSDRIWQNCQSVENGQYEISNGTLTAN